MCHANTAVLVHIGNGGSLAFLLLHIYVKMVLNSAQRGLKKSEKRLKFHDPSLYTGILKTLQQNF